MPQPIDYLPKPLDFSQALQGLQIGSTIRASRERSAAAEQAATLKKQYSADLSATFADPTAEAFAKLTAKYPAQREAFKQSFSMISDEQRENEMAVTGQVYTALQSGNTEVATKILDERIEARKNMGEDTSQLQQLRDNMERDPKNAMGYAGLVLSSVMGPEKFADTFSKLKAEERAVRLDPIKKKKEEQGLLQMGADLKLTTAQTGKVIKETEKLSTDAKKAVLELEAWKDSGGKDSSEVFNQEEKLRKEYTAQTKKFEESKVTLEKIKASAKDKSGAGDLGLVFSFMRMLDPGSVVRESEFALAQDTAGFYAKLKTTAKKLETGQFLTAEQRENFKNLAVEYMESTEKSEKEVKSKLNKVVKNYNLNYENVFGTEEEAETPTTKQKVVRVKF